MNTLILYFSRFGNTQKLAEEIATVFRPSGDVEVRSIEHSLGSDFNSFDLVIMGCPTHKMSVPKVMREFLKVIPNGALKGKDAAVFDTSYKMSNWLKGMRASHQLASRVRGRRARLIGGPQTFEVTAKPGPFYDGELDRAKEWATKILSKYHSVKTRK